MTEIVLSSRFRKAFKRKIRGNKTWKSVFESVSPSSKPIPSIRDSRHINCRVSYKGFGVSALTMTSELSFHSWSLIRPCLLTLARTTKFIRLELRHHFEIVEGATDAWPTARLTSWGTFSAVNSIKRSTTALSH